MDLEPVNLEEIDVQLRGGRVPGAILARLIAADADNSTASIRWLEKRLEILERAAGRGGVSVESPDGKRLLRDASEFRAWCRENFPVISGVTVAAPKPASADSSRDTPVVPRAFVETELWLEDHIIEGENFVFARDGVSKFGIRHTLYSTALPDRLLVSALHGDVARAPFRIPELLTAIDAASKSEPATWALCAEPGWTFANIMTQWENDGRYPPLYGFNRLGEFDSQWSQGGAAYLLLVPASRRWMLVACQKWTSFHIELHGSADFVGDVRRSLGLPA